jgi:hypothetical protein
MKKLKDIKEDKRFRLMQLGLSGKGKTTRALTAVQFGPVAVMDFDGKFAEMKRVIPAEQQDKIMFEKPASCAEYEKMLDEFYKQFQSGKPPFATIVVDSHSVMHEDLVAEVKANNPRMTDGRQIYGLVIDKNKILLQKLLRLPCNVIINAHIGQSEQPDGTMQITVGTTGSFGKGMGKYFNEVHYLTYGEGKYQVRGRVQVTAAGTIESKSLMHEALDTKGIFKVTDLSVFDKIAYKVEK